jgi:hypothetical protein
MPIGCAAKACQYLIGYRDRRFDICGRRVYANEMLDKRMTSPATSDDRKLRMQRVRVGLTGLALVLIVVALATLVTAQFTPPKALQNADNQAASPAAPSGDEPLADLGVAPGAPENKTQ